jgi:hypothetical protein
VYDVCVTPKFQKKIDPLHASIAKTGAISTTIVIMSVDYDYHFF